MAVLRYVSIRDMAGWARVWSLQLPVWMKVRVVGKNMVRGLLGYGRGSDMLGSEVEDWGG